MDVMDAIRTRLEVRDYADKSIPSDVLDCILDAGRLAPSGKNYQHWRFIVVRELDALEQLADISTSGSWVAGADTAIIILTDPTYPYHDIDAGRAITHMQFAAWDARIGSCIYTGYDESAMRSTFDIPEDYAMSAVLALGYPKFDPDDLTGRKARKSLESVAFEGQFGEPYSGA